MYIALVYPYDLRRPGGVRSHVAGLGESLLARGHRVEVIAPSEVDSLGLLPVTPCGRSRGLAFGGTQIDMTWAPWRRVRDVARRGYDLLHFHTIWNPAMPFQLAAAFRGPKVATFHDVAGPDTPTIARLAMGPGGELVRRLLLRQVIAVSPEVAARLTRNRLHVIPNGVAAPVSMPAEGDRTAILFVGRLEPRKGAAILLEAAAQLGPDGPPIWVAGDGPLRADLERTAARLRLAHVSFLGEVPDGEKWALLRRAAIVVAPSLGGESFGIVLLEAMAAGAPPVASDLPGYRHVLADRAAALTFPAGDATALARRIRELLADGSRRRDLQSWGDARWRQFQWSAVVERVEAVYRAALN